MAFIRFIIQSVNECRTLLLGVACCALWTSTGAQSLINVKIAGGNPGAPAGAAVIGAAGDAWNYFANLNGRANGVGVVTNASIIKDATGVTLTGVGMTASLGGGTGVTSFSDATSFFPAPALLMGNYTYENGGASYWSFAFSGLPTNQTYLIYGLGNGNANGQGTTWWADVANGHATASATANFTSGTPIGSRDATQTTNEGVCWIKIPATTTGSGALTFRVVRLGASESGSGGSGREYLNAFQLLRLIAPATTGLTNATVVAGTDFALNPITTGVPAPVFQWQASGVSIAGATNASLSLPNVQFGQNGVVYSLVASNLVGKITNSMMLTVITTPIISGLTNQAVLVGTDVAISASVSGVPAPTLQWQKNGSNLPGATNAAYAIASAQTTDSGTYALIASNAAATVTNSMQLTVATGNVPPNITGPTDQTVVRSNNATFTVSVTGLPQPALQWRVNEADIPGATGSAFTVTNAQYSQNGFVYSLVASNSTGLATNRASLYVLVPPAVSVQPMNLVVTNTQSATFTVTASGVPAVNYQWYFNSNAIAGATAASYFIAATSPASIGSYYVMVTNTVGSATSSAVSLLVNSTMSVPTLIPSGGATGVCYDTPLYINFSTPPVLRTPGNGKIRIYNVNNATTPVDTLDMSQNYTFQTPYAVNTQPRTIGPNVFNEFPVIITSNTAAIYPHPGVLASNQTYYVLVDNGVFTDAAGAYFAGITTSNLWKFATKTAGPANATNLVVAQDYSGDFATVQGAVDFIASGNTTPTIINLRNGTYTEIVLTYNKSAITFRGQSRSGARICYLNNNILNAGSSLCTVFKVNTANDIAVENLTITNLTPQSVAQAFALLVDAGSARFICNNAEISGYQDTIFINQATQTAYFNNSLIQGDVDYIWGSGVGFFTNCQINTLRATGGYVTQPRAPAGGNGLSFVNCAFTVPNSSYHNSVFARAIGVANGNTALINCRVDTNGYSGWNATDVSNTNLALRWWEYGNSNLTATAAAVFNGTQLAGKDSNLTNARSSTLWLGGWTPKLAPNLISQPASQSSAGGQPVSFAVAATGVPEPAYQWKFNGVTIPGATNATLTFLNVSITNAGAYSVTVSNASGTMASSNAILSVANSAPRLAPVSTQIINAGTTLNVTNLATDIDAPPQTLVFSLLHGPLNSSLSAAGILSWRPPVAQAGTTNSVSIVVTDNGTPNLSETNNFNVIVNPVSKPSFGNVLFNGAQLSVTINGGPVGPDYIVEVSTNLTGWQTWLTSNSPPQPFTFIDTTAPGAPARFYRVRLSP